MSFVCPKNLCRPANCGIKVAFHASALYRFSITFLFNCKDALVNNEGNFFQKSSIGSITKKISLIFFVH